MTSADRQRARTRLAESTATQSTPAFGTLAFGGLVVVAVALVWLAPTIALVLVAGLLIGLLLDGLVRALDSLLPVSHATRFGLVVVTLVSIAYGCTLHGGRPVLNEVAALRPAIETQASTVRSWLQLRGLVALPARSNDLDNRSTTLMLGDRSSSDRRGPPVEIDPRGVLSHSEADVTPAKAGGFASYAAAIRHALGPSSERLAVGLLPIASALAVLVLGLALAARPSRHRDAFLRLAPQRQRWRLARFADGATDSLRKWLLARLGSMVVIFGGSWAGLNHLGIDNAMSLALAAGLAAFVPVVGPLVVGGLIGLATLAAGAKTAFGALALYLAVLALERFIAAPLFRWRRTDLSLAAILAGQLALGALLGPWGLVLAVPVLLVLKEIAGEVALTQDEPVAA